MNIRAAKAGLAITEVPSVEHERIHGESKLRPVRDGLRVLNTILHERMTGRTSRWESAASYAHALREPHVSIGGEGTPVR